MVYIVKYPKIISAIAYAVVHCVCVFSTNSCSLATAKPLPTRQKTERGKRGKEIAIITLSAKMGPTIAKKRDFFINSCDMGKIFL